MRQKKVSNQTLYQSIAHLLEAQIFRSNPIVIPNATNLSHQPLYKATNVEGNYYIEATNISKLITVIIRSNITKQQFYHSNQNFEVTNPLKQPKYIKVVSIKQQFSALFFFLTETVSCNSSIEFYAIKRKKILEPHFSFFITFCPNPSSTLFSRNL